MNVAYSNNAGMLKVSAVICLGFPLCANAVKAEALPVKVSDSGNTQVSTQAVGNQTTTIISGGVRSGDNLLHTFEDFDVPTDERVFFANEADVARIFSLVIGNSRSEINGTLGVIGSGDLFFINENGITFGPSARLSVQGSFIATTANRIDFSDGTSLSTDTVETTPLFSSSIPIGLGFSSEVSAITVEDTGHTLAGSGIIPYIESLPESGLSTNPFRTLALVGGEIYLDGGIIRTPDGVTEIGAIENGLAQIEPTPFGWTVDYSNSSSFGEIVLLNAALIDSRGSRGGAIKVTGQNISLLDRSVVTSTGTREEPLGGIEISAARLYIDGASTIPLNVDPSISPFVPVQIVPASIISQSVGTSQGNDIVVRAEQVVLQDGGGITARAFESGSPGNINVRSNSVLLLGSQPELELLLSSINTLSFGSIRNAGSITVDTVDLVLKDGALIASSSFGNGQGGKININAEDVIVDGVTALLQFPSIIQSSAFDADVLNVESSGNGGDVEINTTRLQVSEGGLIFSTATGSGQTGLVSVNASEQVSVFSSRQNSPSAIASEIATLSEQITNPFGVTGTPTGDTGSVSISTLSLIVGEGGSIGVENNGTGNSGTLSINADTIQQLGGGRISAFTLSGEGGDIDINSNSLLLTGNSEIDSSSLGTGDGGNVTIDSDAIALLQDSSISANAELGSGGQVIITTNALLQSPDSSISATSAVDSLQGLVEIQAPDEAPRAESDIEPPAIEVPQVTATCAQGGRQNGEFTVTGRGGLPISPNDIQQTYSGWPSTPAPDDTALPARSSQIAEAQGWLSNGDGTIRFTDRTTNLISASSQPTACVNGRVS